MINHDRNDPGPTHKILIVDDHPAVREALSIRINQQPDLEVCGEAGDLVEALHLVGDTHPEVAIVDIALKGGSGIELIKRLKARDEPVRAIVWSMYSEDLFAERALRAGAMGYLNKEHATDKILDAIRAVLDGKIYLSEASREKLLRQSVGQQGPGCDRSPVESLSDRELDVFRLIGQGLKTTEIASQLHLSPKTVETYRHRIREKLELSDGAALVRFALQWLLENG